MILTTSLVLLLKVITSSACYQFSDIPDPQDTVKMARFIVHKSNWTSVSYISNDIETKGLPLAALFSVSDGPVNNGSGVPYFYVSKLQAAVSSLMGSNSNCSLMMSLAQTHICSSKHLDPEDPRCAHIVLTGTFQKINNYTTEYRVAEEAIFIRHPSLRFLPENHHFFFAKLNIKRIVLQDTFGGPVKIRVSDYFRIHRDSYKTRILYNSNSNRNSIFLFNLFIVLISLLS